LVLTFVNARDEIGMRRERLKRQGGHEDDVVTVKTVQKA
jgi:hypothetical protein